MADKVTKLPGSDDLAKVIEKSKVISFTKYTAPKFTRRQKLNTWLTRNILWRLPLMRIIGKKVEITDTTSLHKL